MTGIVLAGGNGTRLRPLTFVANKHLLPVYNKPMVYYPIETLKDYGCDEVVIVSGGEHIGGFAELLKDGGELGVRITYRVQNNANGVAGSLACVEGLTDGTFPVILGDNFFSSTPTPADKPTIYTKKVEDPERFGVYHDGAIIEKPTNPKSQQAVIGFYTYDNRVFDVIRSLKPSGRGELEITDVNNWHLSNGGTVKPYDGYWSDMGTFDSLLEVANYVS